MLPAKINVSDKIVNKKRRIFFALWPDENTRSKLIKVYDLSELSQLPGKKYQPDNLHLTLCFLGNVSDNQADCALKAAQLISFKSFEINLDCFGFFKKPKVLWMGSSGYSLALNSLHENLTAALSDCGFVLDDKAFTPHVALMRKLPRFDIDVDILAPTVAWRVDRFALVESVSFEGGVVYRPIKFFACQF